jgi:hypothetical protein
MAGAVSEVFKSIKGIRLFLRCDTEHKIEKKKRPLRGVNPKMLSSGEFTY